jgi:hypothetical protein
MEDPKCQFHRDVTGAECGRPAPHLWGPLRLCCGHFDDLVTAMFEIRGLIHDRQHQDFVDIYEARTHKSATAEGAHCEPTIESVKPFIVPKKKEGDE